MFYHGRTRPYNRRTMSDWSKVTRPIPVPNEWTKPFWEAAKQGVLKLQRCQAAGTSSIRRMRRA